MDHAAPSKHSDRYSMAVLLFYLLLVHHPLEGARTEVGLADADAIDQHYVKNPLFCYNPSNSDNRPDPVAHRHVDTLWQALPTRIRRLFTRAFTVGLSHPTRRVVDTEWCNALAEMRSGLYPCGNCTQACFLDDGGLALPCAYCGVMAEVSTLRVKRHQIAVAEGATVTQHHLRNDFDFDSTLGTIEAHPSTPGLYGLRIDLPYADYRVGLGSMRRVTIGERAGLVDRAEIVLDGVTALVGPAVQFQP